VDASKILVIEFVNGVGQRFPVALQARGFHDDGSTMPQRPATFHLERQRCSSIGCAAYWKYQKSDGRESNHRKKVSIGKEKSDH